MYIIIDEQRIITLHNKLITKKAETQLKNDIADCNTINCMCSVIVQLMDIRYSSLKININNNTESKMLIVV